MTKLCYKCRGAISVLLVLIMLPMFVCAGLCVDGSRLTIAKSSVSGAGDLALNAALSEYDEDLHDIYGVFAISEDMDELKDNVKRYFENTINNSSELEGTDSYTRNFIDGLVNSMFAGEQMDFNNIIDTQVEDDSFTLTPVVESSIAKPDNFKKQIVEYMKYRGPVNMARGLLTKLGCIGDTAKQSKALKAKLSYEEDLKDVGNVCKDAYDAIKTYNEGLSGGVFSEGNVSERLSNSVKNARDDFNDMTKYIVAYKSSQTNFIEVIKDDGYRNSIEESYVNDITISDKIEEIKARLKDNDFINLEDNEDLRLSSKIKELKDKNTEDIQSQIEYALDIHDLSSDFNKLYTLAVMYGEYYEEYKSQEEFDDLSDEEKNKYESNNDTLKELCEDMPQLAESMKNMVKYWQSNKAGECGNQGQRELYQWVQDIDSSVDRLNMAIDKVGSIVSKVQSLDGSRTEWSSKINDLQPGTVRTTMQGDYESSAQDINEAAVNDLKSQLEANKNYFVGLKEAILNNTYYEKIIATDISDENYYDRYSFHIDDGEEDSYNAVVAKADTCILENYIAYNYNESDVGIGQIKEGQFFEYLNRIYGGWQDESNQIKKSDAKDKRKEIIKAGNQGTDKTVDTSGIDGGSIIGSIDSSVLSDMENVLSGTGYNVAESDQQNISEDTDDDKEMSKNCKNNLSNVASIFDGIVNILENGRDNLYIEEYVTEMLSCYTSAYSSDGTIISEPTSTLNKQNKLNDHKFYRSEIEYVLFHKDTAEENLKTAKGMIFAIRFALNSVYAFSASDIRAYTSSIATAIAGWTGFGVPIVQSVLTFALAMGESLIDVRALCEGKDVALYKSENTWSLSVTGLKNTVSTELQNMIVSRSSIFINDIFNKINDISSDAIDSVSLTITEYANNTTDSVVQSVKSSVVNPLQTQILNLISAPYDLTDSLIREKLYAVLDSIKSNSVDTGDMGYFTNEAVDVVKAQCIEPLVIMIEQQFEVYKASGQSAVEGITSVVNDNLDYVAKIIKNKVNQLMDTVNNELKQEVNTVLSDTRDEAKAVAKEKITQLIDNYNCKLSGTQVVSDSTKADISKDRTGMSGGLTMSYKEYLKVFCLLYCMTNSDGILSRTAQMVQINVASDNGSFNIAKSYTMLQAGATVSIRTSFLDVVSTNGNSIELDYSNIGTGRQKIKYLGINGY